MALQWRWPGDQLKSAYLPILLFGLLVHPVIARADSLALSSGAALPGGNVTLNLTLNSATATAAQWTVAYSAASISAVTAAAGASATAAGKSLTCAQSTGSYSCILYGVNQNLLQNGTVVATITLTLSATATGTVPITLPSVMAANSNGTSISSFSGTAGSITVSQPPVISSATTANGTVGSAFSYQIAASNSPTSYNATGLPAGLSVNTGTGLISGTPTAAGTSTVTLSATNTAGTGNATLTLTVTAKPVISSSTAASGTVGSAFSYQITASNSPTSYGATGLPSGLSVNTGTGLISGTPTAAGTSTVTLSATNSAGTGNATLTLTVTATLSNPVISSSATASGTVGSAFSYQITASNSPTSYGATGLPSGLSVNTGTGLISGTPTAAGTSTVTLSAINSAGTGNATLTLTVTAAVPVLVTSVSCTPSTLSSGSSSSCTATLNQAAPAGGSTVNLSSSSAALTVPASVLVLAGSTNAAFTATAGSVATNQTATVTATLNASAQDVPLSLIAGAPSGVLISTFTGGNPPPTPMAAASASIGPGRGVVVDTAGNVYFNSSLHCTFKVDTSGNLTRLAGTCQPGFSGDGGAGTTAQFNAPDGIAVDGSGNVYISDRNNHRVRKVSTSGIVTTVAGTGTPGYSGDNGPGTEALLNSPAGLALDGSGNLYISDSNNSVIRQLSPTGTITTIAATSAQLHLPQGVAVDAAGNLYIADTGNNRVREVSSGVISTVATTAQPIGVAAVSPGVFYLTTASGIGKVSSGGAVVTVAGTGTAGYSGDGGAATSAQLNNPYGLGLDLAGDVYIADAGNYRIRKLAAGGTIATVAGVGTRDYSGDGAAAGSAQISLAPNTAVDSSGNVYIADLGNNRIRKVTVSGAMSTIAGTGVAGNSGDNGGATSALVGSPSGVAVDSSGNVYLTAIYGVRKVTVGGIISTVAGTGTAGYSGDGGAATSAQLNNPYAAIVDSSGNLYVSDSGNNRVRKITAGGVITTIAGIGTAGFSGDGGAATSAQLSNPAGLTLDSSGNLYIADLGNNRVRKVASGVITTVAGTGTAGYSGDGGAAASAQLNGPSGVATDPAGNLYIADQGNSRVREVASGVITTLAGTGIPGYSGDGGSANLAALYQPAGVTVDSSGHLYIADTASNAIRVVSLAVTSSSSSSGGSSSGGSSSGGSSSGGTSSGGTSSGGTSSGGTSSGGTSSGGSNTATAGVGIYRSSNGLWLENSTFNNTFSAADTVTSFAGSGLTSQPGDIPVTGDWSGNGIAKIGLYRPSTGTWFLDYNGNGVFDGPTVDRQYQYGGVAGDIPVVGDWSGSGFSKVGIFRSGFLWVLDSNGNGVFDTGDQTFAYGGATGCTGPLPGYFNSEPAGSCDIPVVADWNKSGTAKVGVVRAGPGTSQPFLWILDTTGAQQIIQPGAGVTNPSTIFAFGGIQGDVPVVGDWTGSGTAKVGVFRSGFFWVEDTTASLPTPPSASDTLVAFPYGGVAGDIPVVGHW